VTAAHVGRWAPRPTEPLPIREARVITCLRKRRIESGAVLAAALAVGFVGSTVAANRLVAERLAQEHLATTSAQAAPLPAETSAPPAPPAPEAGQVVLTSTDPTAPVVPGAGGHGPEPEADADADPGVDPAPEVEPEPEPGAGAGDPGPEADGAPVGLLPNIDPDQLARVAASTDIPPRALQAYAGAALRLQQEQPGCNVSWSTLAAIGRVESIHGTLGGGHIGEDGWPTQPIVGPPLDGGPGVRAIRDTDGGKWDGDTTWDRAVGPMQFIPSTWRRWAVDANGDGQAHPQHIDDAALAAGRYLCASGRDLDDGRAWSEAILSYNRSESYVRTVLEWTNRYARASHG
jgi:membrane-bound lytic murein transglycosylase B